MKLATAQNTVAEYTYDGQSRRNLKKTFVAGVLDRTRHFYFTDQWQVAEERVDSSSDGEYRQFVWGVRYVDDLVLRDRDTNSVVGLDERLYVLQDPLWSVTAIATISGDVCERIAYAAYGSSSTLTPSFAMRASSLYDWETRYAGYRWDGESACHHVRWRYFVLTVRSMDFARPAFQPQ